MTNILAKANPKFPEVTLDKPSDALEAQRAADDAFITPLLGLGAISLLVGGLGITNVMVISALKRRSEIGLQRALGATRFHIAVQFLGEALLLGAIGDRWYHLGGRGCCYLRQPQKLDHPCPSIAMIGGITAALLIGGMASSHSAIKAVNLSPAEALRTT